MSYYIEIDGKPLCTWESLSAIACAYEFEDEARRRAESMHILGRKTLVREGPCPVGVETELEERERQEQEDARYNAPAKSELALRIDTCLNEMAENAANVIGACSLLRREIQQFKDGRIHELTDTAVDLCGCATDIGSLHLLLESLVALRHKEKMETVIEVLRHTRSPEEQLMDAQDLAEEEKAARGEIE